MFLLVFAVNDENPNAELEYSEKWTGETCKEIRSEINCVIEY